MSDPDLLARYVQHGDHDAFRTLVERHVGLVYAVARRHVRDEAAAKDVAQAVFIELARGARQIKPAAPLVAWLHLVSRRTALNALRGEIRRQARESTAALLETMNPPPPAWTEIEPLLDEAVESLAETDRSAILLRFFENKSLREIGAALGTSDDAAQKRVSRAVDELRAFFVRRGVAMTASGLATTLGAHAASFAPAGLGLAIAQATALSGATASFAAAETTRVLAMTTLQKSLLAAAFALVGGAGIYESVLAARSADDLDTLRAQTERTAAELRRARADRDDVNARLKNVEQQIDTRLAQAKAALPTDPALIAEMKNWFTRIDRLKDEFARRPGASIPELKHLDPAMWFELVGSRSLDTDDDVRRAMADVRRAAEGGYSGRLSTALRSYVAAHDGVLPNSPLELSEYLNPPVDREILARYEMLASGKVADLPAAQRRQVLAIKTPPDPEFDGYALIGPDSHGATAVAGINLMTAIEAYTKEHPGERPVSAAQLKPHLRWPMSDAAVQKYLDLMTRNATR